MTTLHVSREVEMHASQLVLLLATLMAALPGLSALRALPQMTAVVSSSKAITCYQCSYPGDNGCEDPFRQASQTCTGSVCVKSKWSNSSYTLIYRGCDDDPTTGCISGSLSGGIKIALCFCDKERCNSAQQLYYRPHTAIILLLVILVTRCH